MILRIVILILGLLPKNLRKAAQEALDITTRLKKLLEENADLLKWTGLDEKYIHWHTIIEQKVGRKGETLKEYLESLKPDSLNGELANIASIIMQEMVSKYPQSFCKCIFEANYTKQKEL